MTQTTANPVAILNELLDDELHSPLRYIQQSMPYFEARYARLWVSLKRLANSQMIRAGELIRMINTLGGEPTEIHPVREEQYLAFLSLDYLKPRLVEWKNATILRHERALMLLGEGDRSAVELIVNHLEQHREELDAITAD